MKDRRSGAHYCRTTVPQNYSTTTSRRREVRKLEELTQLGEEGKARKDRDPCIGADGLEGSVFGDQAINPATDSGSVAAEWAHPMRAP